MSLQRDGVIHHTVVWVIKYLVYENVLSKSNVLLDFTTCMIV